MPLPLHAFQQHANGRRSGQLSAPGQLKSCIQDHRNTISTGSTSLPSPVPKTSPLARAMPCTTGLTISRCEGLNASSTSTGPSLVCVTLLKPLWYLNAAISDCTDTCFLAT